MIVDEGLIVEVVVEEGFVDERTTEEGIFNPTHQIHEEGTGVVVLGLVLVDGSVTVESVVAGDFVEEGFVDMGFLSH